MTLEYLIAETAASTESASAAAEAIQIVTEYSDVKVPVFNMIMEGLALILFIGALVTAAILIFNHVRNWMLPFVAGIVFYLVFVFVLMQLLAFGLNFLISKNPELEAHVPLFEFLLSVMSGLMGITAMVVGMLYWRKSERKKGNELTLGGSIAFGFSFYAGIVLTGGNLSKLFQMIFVSRAINASGFDAVVSGYVANGAKAEEAIEAFLPLTANTPEIFVQLAMNAFIVVLEGVVFVAAAVLFYGALTYTIDRKWMIASIALHVLIFMPTAAKFLAPESNTVFYVSFGYTIVIAALSAALVIFLAKRYMPDEVQELAYSKRQQRRDEEAKKNKIPHIVMPKD